MKNSIGILILLFLFCGCEKNQKCDTLRYTFHLPSQLLADYPYVKLYQNQEDFYQGVNAITVEDSTNGLTFSTMGNNQFTPIWDIRRADGTSSWSDQQALAQLADHQVFFEECSVDVHYTDADALLQAISSSPIYTHLALPGLDQDGGSKTWEISRIFDEDSVEVTERPEWICIKSLVFTFYKGGKGGKIKIGTNNGQSPCGVYEELFNGMSEAYATYSLEGEDQRELRITAPAISDALKEQLTFHIASSSYEQLAISLTNADGQIGYATLTPLQDEE